MKKAIIVLAVVLSAGLILGGWLLHDKAPIVARPVRQADARAEAKPVGVASWPKQPAADFAGSQSCRECHEDECNEYAGHPMAYSLEGVLGKHTPEDYTHGLTFNATPRRQYRVERNEKGVWHHEIAFDAKGSLIFDQATPVQFAMGSGKRGRSYVINREGWLYISPISWYSQAHRWDLSPGYSGENHLRFSRQALERCLQCHVGRLAYRDGEVKIAHYQRYADPPFREQGISCERCHGPGKKHIAARRDLEAADDPIINPENLPPPQRDAVCNQCHLAGKYQILRYGRSHNDFRPGDNIGDIWTVFVEDVAPEDAAAETTAVSQMEQMYTSQCFRGSRAALGCISCHTGHSTPEESTKHAFYRNRCLTCHREEEHPEEDHRRKGCELSPEKQSAATPPGSCIACHMPRFDASDIPHTAQTDHRILRKPLARKKAESGSHEFSLRIFDLAVCKLSPTEHNRAQGLVLASRAESFENLELARRAESLLGPLQLVFPHDTQLLDALAICSEMQGRAAAAAELWQRILAHDPHNLQTLYSLLTSYQQQGKPDLAIPIAERYLALNNWSEEVHSLLSRLLAEKDNLPLARAHAERAVEINPANIAGLSWLAEIYRRMERGDDYEKTLEIVRRLTE